MSRRDVVVVASANARQCCERQLDIGDGTAGWSCRRPGPHGILPGANLRFEISVNRQRVDLRRVAPLSEQIPHHAGVVSNRVAPMGRRQPLVRSLRGAPDPPFLRRRLPPRTLKAPGRYCRISSSSSAILNCRQKSCATTGEPRRGRKAAAPAEFARPSLRSPRLQAFERGILRDQHFICQARHRPSTIPSRLQRPQGSCALQHSAAVHRGRHGLSQHAPRPERVYETPRPAARRSLRARLHPGNKSAES